MVQPRSEYAVMLALIVVVCIAAITAMGSNSNKTFQQTSALNTAVKQRFPDRDRLAPVQENI